MENNNNTSNNNITEYTHTCYNSSIVASNFSIIMAYNYNFFISYTQ